MEFFERISILRKELKLSQDKFGEKLGVSRDVINNIEHNRLSRPEQKEPLYRLICQEFNVNEHWLRTGEGDMFLELPPEDEVAAAVSEVLEDIHCENSFYTLIKEILVQHERLDEESQKQIDSFFDNVLKGIVEKREEP